MAEALLDREDSVTLIAQAEAGNTEAVAALLHQYDGRIYRLALSKAEFGLSNSAAFLGWL